ncbi:hypothetical protein NE236_08330 [Actinoallomurus purpureus]|uniref:hypothetical protein n=1 Tax=Actinoallomurus purpureus TaxID=478114 RepID=UPI0020920151|nr:hypothetical protein [Actinoallomurus purpureus]MCO6004986.1 hypothetical protein [Actinoallomurus purpureus]
MRKLSMVLVGAAAAAGLALTGGTASATTVHTDNATKCGSKWCAAVVGKGLKVNTVTIYRPNHKMFSGYPYVEVAAPHHKTSFIWGPKVKNAVEARAYVYKKFPNKTMLCSGVAPHKVNQDYAGDACAVVHS